MKLLRAILATILFLVVLVVIYVVHVRLFRVDVVFYAALLDVILATAAVSTIAIVSGLLSPLGRFERAQLFIIWLLAGYTLAISVPTVIDRSLSFYILEKLNQRGGGILQSSFADVFAKEYMIEHRLVDVRLTEQLASGTLVIVDGCVKLTDKGRKVAYLSRYFRSHWLPKHRLLLGQYTDDLTEPFRRSIGTPHYTCK